MNIESRTGPDDMKRPLDGVKVLDLTRALAGPYCTMMLADAGADVVKVEPPGGDDSRGWLPVAHRGDDSESAYFLSANRGKRSIRLDLKTARGVERFRRLVDEADVLVENYRVGLMDRLGLGLADLRAANPQLITASITGFGSSGPDATRGGFDQIIQAEAGLMSLVGDSGGGPTRVGLPISDILAGMFAAYGISIALRERERTGRGSAVDTSLLAAVVGVHTFQGAGWLSAGVAPRRTGNRHPSIAPYGTFRCQDAEIVLAVGSESLWRRFAQMAGIDPDRPDIAENADRVEVVDALEQEISQIFSTRLADDVLADLRKHGVPAGRIRTLPEVYEWDQVREQGLVQQLDHPSLGAIKVPGAPLRLDGQTLISTVPPPKLGEHDNDLIWDER